ncbi:sucrose synthase [Thiohalocapsa marina]|uniref:Sucrose synthase n=1 Tax=Thiohalocapsa marina TaxID=424902 RepID=A0A5M8FKW7_9GAMM|nr:sucrose synthase [Thiohalocapsa marina]KAA6184630.1 sucrose synthase [Thiohalocapsa marina]
MAIDHDAPDPRSGVGTGIGDGSGPDRELTQLIAALRDSMRAEPGVTHRILHRILGLRRAFLLQSDLQDAVARLLAEEPALDASPLTRTLRQCQEAVIDDTWIYLALRRRIACWDYLRLHLDTLDLHWVSAAAFLGFKEHLATGRPEDPFMLEVDMTPFDRERDRLREEGSIGRGGEFLNRSLSSRLFADIGKGAEPLLRFLRMHRCRDQQLMLDGSISTLGDLRNALRQALIPLRRRPAQTPWAELAAELRNHGFEPGWGKEAARIRDTMGLLLDILEAPSPQALEDFLGRVPMIFSIAILSPHGWFGQSNVLGRPDTGGQVVYILDQVRALEQEMRQRLQEQGIDIEPRVLVLTRLIPEAEGSLCNQRLEPIAGTRNAAILRVPFRTSSGEELRPWISRFRVWPYLERFALDAERELLAELGGRPDLIIGNYSDGNLLASLMADRLGVSQCNIAHALEKPKYLFSDLYWGDNEQRYHFSVQFTADLIAMNAADFIVTSTYQEIAGTDHSVGQYESYTHFTLPGLYRVTAGIDVYDPKFNIVSPGANADVYFPFSEQERRLSHLQPDIDDLLYGDARPGQIRGVLARRDRPLLFTMARLDRIKNISGLLDWYGQCAALREQADLVVVAGHVDAEASADDEEREQITEMHRLFDRHGLDTQVRWIGMHLDKPLTGELYRCIADGRGAFVQPALFEAFGLTVIEAMSCGLPCFATCYGGPLEIIQDGVSGYHIDPNHGAKAARRMAEVLQHCAEDSSHWTQLSTAGLARIEAQYTWRHHARRLMTLARIYGFWRHVTDLDRAQTRRYLQLLYGLQYRPLAATLE